MIKLILLKKYKAYHATMYRFRSTFSKRESKLSKLDLKENNLVENAEKVGAVLKAELEGLAKKHAMIGQVRGRGLLLALELVENRDDRTPFASAKDAAQTLTDIAFNEGIII
jgi:4-aminobutyrate aminotransferase-like enzyme